MKIAMMSLLAGLFVFNFAGQKALADHHEKGEHKAKMETERKAVESACSADASTTGCSGKEVGKGLLKCMHEYKKAHKDFKFSDSCKGARKEMKHEKNELKQNEEHEEKK